MELFTLPATGKTPRRGYCLEDFYDPGAGCPERIFRCRRVRGGAGACLAPRILADRSILARFALQVKRKLDLYLSSCQLGVTLASLGLGAVTEPAVAAIVEPSLRFLHLAPHDIGAIAFTLAMGLSTSLHIVIGEQAPKNWAINYSDWLLPIVAGPLIIFTYIFFPRDLAA